MEYLDEDTNSFGNTQSYRKEIRNLNKLDSEVTSEKETTSASKRGSSIKSPVK